MINIDKYKVIGEASERIRNGARLMMAWLGCIASHNRITQHHYFNDDCSHLPIDYYRTDRRPRLDRARIVAKIWRGCTLTRMLRTLRTARPPLSTAHCRYFSTNFRAMAPLRIGFVPGV